MLCKYWSFAPTVLSILVPKVMLLGDDALAGGAASAHLRLPEPSIRLYEGQPAGGLGEVAGLAGLPVSTSAKLRSPSTWCEDEVRLLRPGAASCGITTNTSIAATLSAWRPRPFGCST